MTEPNAGTEVSAKPLTGTRGASALVRPGWIALLLALLALAAGGWWLHSNLDRLVQRTLVHYGSAILGVDVKVGSVALDTTSGRGTVSGVVVGNPRGFKTPYAFKVDSIELEIDLRTVTQDVIVVKKVAVLAPEVFYEQGSAQTNFEALQKNIIQSLGTQVEPASAKPRKLMVDEFTVRHAKAQGSVAFLGGKVVVVDLPDIVLHNLGRAQGGLSPAELGQVIGKAVLQQLVPAFSWNALKKSVGEGLDKAGDALKGWFQK